MNERIKKLADKIWSLDIEPNPHFQLCLQAFAESIVQECESVSINNSHRDDDMGAIIARKIKEHFGVEQ
jgi:hypothetical protein